MKQRFAFGFSWCCSTAVFPRLVRQERQGYWATVGAYGVIAPFFVVAGGVLAIVTFITTGALDNDLAKMLIQIASPLVALITLVLIVFANVGTHGTGTYMWSVVIKSAFPTVKYSIIVAILAAYAALIVLWGGIIDYFGAMISIAAYLYGPIMGLLFVDYFWVRKRKLDLRSAYELQGWDSYRYSNGYNLIGFACLIVGFLASFDVFDAVSYTARLPIFSYQTSSFLGFLVAGAAYFAASRWIPKARQYLLPDRGNVTSDRQSSNLNEIGSSTWPEIIVMLTTSGRSGARWEACSKDAFRPGRPSAANLEQVVRVDSSLERGQ